MGKWRKVLYERQPFPDNHTDRTFLSALRKNENVVERTYAELVVLSGNVTQQLSAVAVFAALFVLLRGAEGHGAAVLGACSLLTGLGFAAWDARARGRRRTRWARRLATAKNAFFFIVVLLGLTPILQSLTKDVSSDSVYVLTMLMFLANVVFHDYSDAVTTRIKSPESISLNAAVFGAALLASRLSTKLNVFTIVIVALQLFGLFPILRRHLRSQSDSARVAITVLLHAAALAVLTLVQLRSAAAWYAGLMIFIHFVSPALMIRTQRFKNELKGPWDEATITLSKES